MSIFIFQNRKLFKRISKVLTWCIINAETNALKLVFFLTEICPYFECVFKQNGVKCTDTNLSISCLSKWHLLELGFMDRHMSPSCKLKCQAQTMGVSSVAAGVIKQFENRHLWCYVTHYIYSFSKKTDRNGNGLQNQKCTAALASMVSVNIQTTQISWYSNYSSVLINKLFEKINNVLFIYGLSTFLHLWNTT